MDEAGDFYDELAADYDQMTRFNARLESERQVLAGLVQRFGIRRAVDVACGTGLHAILLSELGVEMVGTDLSAAMLAKAEAHAAERGARVRWLPASLQALATTGLREQDAVLCLGNSLPHLLTPADLRAALGGIATFLRPGGVFIVQLRNYEQVLATRERLVGVRRDGDTEYLRFYDFLGDQVVFNVLVIAWGGARPVHRWLSTPLCPYTSDRLAGPLQEAGLAVETRAGALTLGEFSPTKSSDLVIVARRG